MVPARSAEVVAKVFDFVGVSSIVGSSPGTGRSKRAISLRAALPCLALTALGSAPAAAQSLTPDLLQPDPRRLRRRPTRCRRAAPRACRRRRRMRAGTARSQCRSAQAPADAGALAHRPAPDLRPARRQWRQRLRLRFAQPQAAAAEALSRASRSRSRRSDPARRRRRRRRDRRSARRASRRRRPTPRNKTPLPPAMAGTVPGQPLRRRLRHRRRSVRRGRRLRRQLPDQGRARALRRLRHQSRRVSTMPLGSPVYVVAPDFLVVSDWERHALVADLRGSFSGYSNNLPATIDGSACRRRSRSTARILSATSTAASTSAAISS